MNWEEIKTDIIPYIDTLTMMTFAAVEFRK